MEGYDVEETPFEERFAQLPQTVTTVSVEDVSPEKTAPAIIPTVELLPYVEKTLESEASIHGFVSPEIFITSDVDKVKDDVIEPMAPGFDLPPVTLQERIEGALFAIGRPIHVKDLIEHLQAESPLVKRNLRKLQRRQKRTSPIIIEEISKDRWVMQLNPIYHELFSPQMPDRFMEPDERKVMTEIAYRQPISLALVKKMVRGMGPVKVNEMCKRLEYRGFITGEKRARSFVYTTTPAFADAFGFDDESRRLKLQMLWRLKRLMGDYQVEEETEEEGEELKETDHPEEPSVGEDSLPVTETLSSPDLQPTPVPGQNSLDQSSTPEPDDESTSE